MHYLFVSLFMQLLGTCKSGGCRLGHHLYTKKVVEGCVFLDAKGAEIAAYDSNQASAHDLLQIVLSRRDQGLKDL